MTILFVDRIIQVPICVGPPPLVHRGRRSSCKFHREHLDGVPPRNPVPPPIAEGALPSVV